MASLDSQKTAKSLLSKGLTLKDSHHHYYEFWHNGALIAKTYMSHNGQDINDSLINNMKKQCLMDKKFSWNSPNVQKQKMIILNY